MDSWEVPSSKIKVEQPEDAAEMEESECFLYQLIDIEEKVYDQKDVQIKGIEENFFEPVEDVKFEVNGFPKIDIKQSEDVKEEESECFAEQFIDAEGQIWNRNEFLCDGIVDCLNQEVEEANTSHLLNDSMCRLSRDNVNSGVQPEHDAEHTHSKIDKYECDESDSSSIQETKTERVNCVDLNEKIQKCPKCEFSTSEKNSVTKNHKCRICEYTSCRKSAIKQHIEQVHMGVKDHKCHLCQFSTFKKITLKHHIDGVHLGIKNHKCHICEFSACDNYSLKRHVNSVHLEIKNHRCHLCEFSTFGKSTLKDHINAVHLELKNHRCHICEFSTNRKNGLKNHIERIHMAIKNHKCDICEFRAFDKITVINHIDAVHLDLKKHNCHICDYSTCHKGSLKRHIDRVHLGINNHKCPYCEYSTFKKSTLKGHIGRRHRLLFIGEGAKCSY